MYRFIFFSLLVFSLLISDSSKNVLDTARNNEVGIKNPEAQRQVNELKRQYRQDKELVLNDYEILIKNLKDDRNDKVKQLKKEYRKRLKELRDKYPDIPEISLDSKPKPRLKHPKNEGVKDSHDKSFRKKKKKTDRVNSVPLESKPPRKK